MKFFMKLNVVSGNDPKVLDRVKEHLSYFLDQLKERLVMSKKIEYKKDYKPFYLPKTIPDIIEIDEMPFIMISGTGDPNGDEFARETEALYSLSYAVKMSYKSEDVPAGYYEYTVFPLEGIWDLIDKSKSATDKSNLKYTIMIRQPDFLTDELFVKFVEQTKKKKQNPYLEKLTFGKITDGLCCQVMHIGSFEDEPESFVKMEEFSKEKGYVRSALTHREIYLSDPRKTDVSKMKTVLRFPIKRY